jgi:hypothetical protein
MFEQTVETVINEVKKHLLSGADKIELVVEKLEDGNAVIFCYPEYKD